MTPRIALGAVRRLDDRVLRFGAQLGLSGVIVNTPLDLPGEARWAVDDLRRLRERVEAYDLRLEAIENVPIGFYRDAILGGPAEAAQLEHMRATIAALGEAGVPVFGFHWMGNEVWRSELDLPGRGGSRVTAFALDRVADPHAPTHGRVYGEDELWASFERFVGALLPVAEEHGVRLALHPDDPPVPSLGGIPRLFRTAEGLQRAIDVADSPAFGLEFCLGSVSSMGPGAVDALRSFVAQDKVVYVHFRDVLGHVPSFEECFLGEGNVDVVEAMRVLVQGGFDGVVIDDHVPLLDEDPPIATEWTRSEYAYLGRAHAVGMLQGLLRALAAETARTPARR